MFRKRKELSPRVSVALGPRFQTRVLLGHERRRLERRAVRSVRQRALRSGETNAPRRVWYCLSVNLWFGRKALAPPSEFGRFGAVFRWGPGRGHARTVRACRIARIPQVSVECGGGPTNSPPEPSARRTGGTYEGHQTVRKPGPCRKSG